MEGEGRQLRGQDSRRKLKVMILRLHWQASIRCAHFQTSPSVFLKCQHLSADWREAFQRGRREGQANKAE